jgi:hypothetical protein
MLSYAPRKGGGALFFSYENMLVACYHGDIHAADQGVFI